MKQIVMWLHRAAQMVGEYVKAAHVSMLSSVLQECVHLSAASETGRPWKWTLSLRAKACNGLKVYL